MSDDIERQDEETQGEYVRRLRDLLIEERKHPRDADRLGPLDYFALMIYKHERGLDARWLPLHEDVKSEYRDKAKMSVASWAMDELMEARK